LGYWSGLFCYLDWAQNAPKRCFMCVLCVFRPFTVSITSFSSIADFMVYTLYVWLWGIHLAMLRAACKSSKFIKLNIIEGKSCFKAQFSRNLLKASSFSYFYGAGWSAFSPPRITQSGLPAGKYQKHYTFRISRPKYTKGTVFLETFRRRAKPGAPRTENARQWAPINMYKTRGFSLVVAKLSLKHRLSFENIDFCELWWLERCSQHGKISSHYDRQKTGFWMKSAMPSCS